MPDDNQLLRFSYSAVSEWLQCRKRWAFKYRRGLVPIITDSRPVIGSAVHYAIGMAILLRRPGQDDRTFGELIEGALDVWFDEQMEKYEILPAEAYDLLHHELSAHTEKASFIARRALAAINVDDWETVRDQNGSPMVEWEFEREVPGIGVLTGAVDWVSRHRPTDTVWLWDHKIRARLGNALAEDFNIQMALYQHILQQDANTHLAGSITYQVSSKIPGTPKLNKGGVSMSRSAIDTDWETYRQALLDAGLDPADYDDMREKLEAKQFYRPLRYFRSPQHTQAVWGTIFLPAAIEMRQALYEPSEDDCVRSMSSFNCRGCPYVPLCLGELRGDDTSYTERTQYVRRDTSVIFAGIEADPGNGALDEQD